MAGDDSVPCDGIASDGRRITHSKRRLLAALGAGGVAGLAGCGGTGDGDGEDPTGTPTETELAPPTQTPTPDEDDDPSTTTESTDTATPAPDVPEFVDGAKYRISMGTLQTPLPEWDWDKNNITGAEGEGIPRLVYPLIIDYLAETDLVTGDVVGIAMDEWDWTDTSVTYTFKDEKAWSDGSDVLGADLGMPWKLDLLTGPTREEIQAQEGGAQNPWEATTGVTWDGKSVTLHSDGGGYGDFFMKSFVETQLVHASDRELVTDRFIYGPLLEQIEDLGQTRVGQANHEQATGLIDEYFAGRVEEVRENPTDQRFSGPWVLDRISQQNVRLVPNENHRHSPNWAELEIVPMGEEQQRWAGLRNNVLDGESGLTTLPPANVIRALPDNMQMHLWSGGNLASGLVTQGQQELLGDVTFRQGLVRSLRKERVARVNHEFASNPLPDPQGAHWTGARQWMSEDLIESFSSYEYDPDRAAEDFRSLGMTKEGGSWLRPDGSDLTIKYLTDAQTFQYEQTIASMLQDVGIDVQITRIDSATFSNRLDSGDYQMANDYWWTAHEPGYFHRALQQEVNRKKWGVFDEEAVQNWIEEHDNIENVDYDWTHNIEGFTTQQTKRWTVSAPPLGEPEADPTEEYPVVWYEFKLQENIPEAKRREYIQKLSWVWNYTMPIMQLHKSFNIAFQDHEQYRAPEDDRDWAWYGPTYKLMMRGEIQALEAAAEDQ